MSPCLLKKCFHRQPPFLVGSQNVTLVLRRSYAKFTPSNNTVLLVPMATYVSPAHLATKLQFDRIEDAARREAPVLEILNAGSATTVKAVKKAFISLSKQIHPQRGGNFDKERASSAQVIVARAFEQAKRAAEFDSYKTRIIPGPQTSTPSSLFPETFYFRARSRMKKKSCLQHSKMLRRRRFRRAR